MRLRRWCCLLVSIIMGGRGCLADLKFLRDNEHDTCFGFGFVFAFYSGVSLQTAVSKLGATCQSSVTCVADGSSRSPWYYDCSMW